ncbi:MAG TPA: hypothetical protein VE344_01415 [Methylomirabilota bacterium]|nr:hypothetical protein [Methylomirabilota bacterium]
MNDFELESKLKSVRVPARSEDYWEEFPSQVRLQLRPIFAERAPQKKFLPRLAWSGGFVLACLFFVLAIWPALQIALKNERTFRRELAELPHHLHVFMADEHGLHYLIAEQQ